MRIPEAADRAFGLAVAKYAAKIAKTPDAPVSTRDLGPVPAMAWLSVDDLVVDNKYQRDTARRSSKAQIEKIAREFAWRKFQPLTVAGLTSGTFAVLDGQHRAAAARLVPVTHVPCYIVEAPELEAQASTFVAVNRDRLNVTPIQLHQALVAAGDTEARRIQAICDQAGVAIVTDSRTAARRPLATVSVAAISHALRNWGEGAAARALKIIAAAFPETGDQLRAPIIKAMAMAARLFEEELDDARMARALSGTSADELIGGGRAYKRIHGGSTDRAVLATLLAAYNKGLSSKRLHLPEGR